MNAATFFTLCLIQTIFYQSHLKLRSGNLLMKLVELHTISLLGCFTSHTSVSHLKHPDSSSSIFTTSKVQMIHLTICLYLCEIILSQYCFTIMVQLYAIGRQMTLAEVNHIFMYAKTRQGSLFKVRVNKHVDASSQKQTVVRRFEISNEHASLSSMLKNIFGYLVLGRELKSGLNPKISRQPNGRAASELRLWQLAQ